jgi:hypothetical protein
VLGCPMIKEDGGCDRLFSMNVVDFLKSYPTISRARTCLNTC